MRHHGCVALQILRHIPLLNDLAFQLHHFHVLGHLIKVDSRSLHLLKLHLLKSNPRESLLLTLLIILIIQVGSWLQSVNFHVTLLRRLLVTLIVLYYLHEGEEVFRQVLSLGLLLPSCAQYRAFLQ